MTARQAIEYAELLTVSSSMYELQKARTLLNRTAEFVTTPELVERWGYASEHINDTMADQMAMAKAGQTIRIM